MTIWERMHAALTPLNIPMARDELKLGSEGEIPDLFLVYSLLPSEPAYFADDDVVSWNYAVRVSLYYRANVVVIPNVAGAMKTAGFSISSRQGLPFSQETDHYGEGLDFNYLEERED